jgi:hypothetical protein
MEGRMGERALREKLPQPQLRELEKKMNRFRTGRGAPPWAWMQTGPLTVDVEACMSNKDRGEVKYVSPTNVRHEYVPPAAPADKPTENTPSKPFNTVKLVYTGPSSTDGGLPREDGLLADSPAFRAAVDENPGAAKSTPNRPRSKAKPAKRKRKPATTRITLRPSAPRKQPRPRTQDEIDLSRHKRRCGVCHDPAREAIEEAFLQWRNVECIDSEFEPEGGRSAIYRHAHALNLFRKRSLNLRSALEYIIEESERISPTAEGIVKAMRAYTRINDVGEWIDTPTTHIVQVIAMPAADPRNPANPIQGLSLDVRKERSQIIESGIRQPLLTETAPHSEIAVTD